MIELRAASLVSQNTSRVVLEDWPVRLNGHGDGLLQHRGLKRTLRRIHISAVYEVVGRQNGIAFRWAHRVCALCRVLVHALVRVVSLRTNAVLSHPLEGLVHGATAAPVATVVAVE